MVPRNGDLDRMWQELVRLGNEQFESRPFKRLLGVNLLKSGRSVAPAHMLMQVARKYATTESARQAIVDGVKESLIIDRVYRGHLADMLAALN